MSKEARGHNGEMTRIKILDIKYDGGSLELPRARVFVPVSRCFQNNNKILVNF